MEFASVTTLFTLLTSAVIGGGSAFFMFRRKISRDGLELTKDRAEIDIIEFTTKQRDEAISDKKETDTKLQTVLQEKEDIKKELLDLKREIEKARSQLNLSNRLCERLTKTLDATKKELEQLVKEQKNKE